MSPHPATIAIGRILSHVHNTFALESAAITVLEPASARGNAGVDELQEQAVSLLNFQQTESKTFNGQLAFNMLPEPEASARTQRRIIDQLQAIFGKTFPKPAIAVVQAPVFHSNAFSMFINVLAGAEELSAHLARNTSLVVDGRPGGPSPVSVVGSDKIHIGQLQSVLGNPAGYALWVVADNLRIAASNAIQTAEQIMLAPALEA